MFGKIKCPACGAKNSKERMTCASCGAPLAMTGQKTENAATHLEKAAHETPQTIATPARKLDGESVIFSSPATTSNHGKADITLTETRLVFQADNNRVEIPLPSIRSFDFKMNYNVVSTVRRPPTGAVAIEYADTAADKNRDLVFHLKQNEMRLLQHYIYKRIAGNYIDTSPSKIKDIYELNVSLLNGLRSAGLEARLAAPKQLEEKIEAEFSLGLIAIEPGPIRWVNIRTDSYENLRYAPAVTTSRNQFLETLERIASRDYYHNFVPDLYYTDYGVPDFNMPPDYPIMGIYLEENDGHFSWTGIEPARHIVKELNARPELRHPAFNQNNVMITPYSQYSCWIISVKGALKPDSELWNCYQEIASLLLNSTTSVR